MGAREEPLVSVILPTYNRAEVLPQSIRSVLNQSYDEIELIVIDDGSQDPTEKVINRFDDPRLRYIAHEQNRGASAARNTGIEAARGELIAFQDSDDEWLPRKLQKQINVFNEAPETVGVVYTGMWRNWGGECRYVPSGGVRDKQGDISRSIMRNNFISTQTATVRSSCFEHAGVFDGDLGALIDWDLWIRLSERYRFRLIDEPLVRSRVRWDSISVNTERIVSARERIVKKHRERFDSRSMGNNLFFVGHGWMKLGQTARGRQYLKEALRTHPRPTYIGAWLLSLLGSEIYKGVYRGFKSLVNGRIDIRLG